MFVEFGGGAFAQPAQQKWLPFVDFEAKPGTKRSLGEADIFQPLWQNSDTLLFADVRGRFDDQDSREGNAGLGLRHMLASGWNLGVYGYYDRRRTQYDNYFNQATFGGELLGRDLDFRGNVYLPFGTRVQDVDSLNTAELSGASIVFHGGEERALPGFDAEVGWRVPFWAAEADKVLRIYAGGFRFDDGVAQVVAGPRLRAEFTMLQVPGLWDGARLTLGAEFQHDDVRGSQGFAIVRLRVPLSRERPAVKLTAQEQRMVDRVERDVDVVSQAGAFGPAETVTQTANGQSLTVLSSNSTTGANLPTAVTNAGANSFVILTGSFTTNSNNTGVVTLKSGQTLMGAGSLAVRNVSGRTAVLTTPGATITGNVGSSNYTIKMATNSTLTGMTINNTDNTGNNAQGVVANGISGARIINNTIVSTEVGVGGTAHGIDVISSSSNITVSGNTITARGGAIALAVQVNTSSATVTGNTLSASGATTNEHTVLSNANILSGSSGNTVGAGNCSVSAAGTGTKVTYTNAADCGP